VPGLTASDRSAQVVGTSAGDSLVTPAWDCGRRVPAASVPRGAGPDPKEGSWRRSFPVRRRVVGPAIGA
jgi:hypothetical protein